MSPRVRMGATTEEVQKVNEREAEETAIRELGQQVLESSRPDVVETEGLVVADVVFVFEVVDQNMSSQVMSLTSTRRRPWLRFGLLVPELLTAAKAIMRNHREG